MAGKGVSRISVSLPPEVLTEFDETIGFLGLTRSKAIQVAMRDFLTEHRWAGEKGAVAGALTMIYDHEVRGLNEALTDVQHDYRHVITSTTHVHLDERNCLEIVAVRGEAKTIRRLARELMTKRGIKQLKLSILLL